MNRKKCLQLSALVMAAFMWLVQPVGASMQLNGSGASFPYQIYSLWFMLFNREHKESPVEYIAKGSGSGIKDFQRHAVDFAASDAAMNEEEIAKVKEGVQLLPMTAGEVVLVYNLKGFPDLKLTREAYSGIFLGKVKRWNDPVIADANVGIQLPDTEITVVTRMDSSGTSFVFTKHLSAISEEFANGPGYGKKVDWPANVNMRKARLNLGISGMVRQVDGAIGYMDYGFASIANHQVARLENRAGKFVAPGLEGGQAALANAIMPENMIVWLSDPEGEGSYPITTYTWMMFYQKYDDPKKAALMRELVTFCLDNGQKISDRFGYIPLPPSVVEKVRTASVNIQ